MVSEFDWSDFLLVHSSIYIDHFHYETNIQNLLHPILLSKQLVSQIQFHH